MLCRLGQEGSGWHSHALSYSTRCWVPGGAYNGQNRQPQGLHGTSERGCTHGLQLVPLVSRPPTLPVPRAPGRCAAPNLRNAERDTRGGISEATPPLAHTRPPHRTGRAPTWQPGVGGAVDAGRDVETRVPRRAGPPRAGGSPAQNVTSHVPGQLRGLQGETELEPGRRETPLLGQHFIPSRSPWWGLPVAAVQLLRATSSHPVRSLGAPAPGGLGKLSQHWGDPLCDGVWGSTRARQT